MTRFVPVTHRCDGRISPDGGWCEEEDKIDCPALRRADGTIENSIQCGEPCSWIMGKGGHGSPPWESVAGMRRDPHVPDPGFEGETVGASAQNGRDSAADTTDNDRQAPLAETRKPA